MRHTFWQKRACPMEYSLLFRNHINLTKITESKILRIWRGNFRVETSPTNPCWNDGEVSTDRFTLSLPWKCSCHNLSPAQQHIHICMSPLCQYNNYREIRQIFRHGISPKLHLNFNREFRLTHPQRISPNSPGKLREKIRGDNLRKIPHISMWKYGGRGWHARWA